MDLKVIQRPVLYIANHVKLGENAVLVPLGGLDGVTRSKGAAFYVSNITESTAGMFVGPKKRNVMNATSYPYSKADPIIQRKAIFNAITNKAFRLLAEGGKNMFVFICGGLGRGAKEDLNLIQRSRRLYYDIEECIEERLPNEEGLDIQGGIIWGLNSIWGRKNTETPLALYVNNGSIALVGDIFSKLFKNQKRKYTQEELRNILSRIFENFKLPDEFLIIDKEYYEPHKCPQEYMLRKVRHD